MPSQANRDWKPSLLPIIYDVTAQSCVVYAGNLSWTTTDEQLLAFANPERGAISTEIKRHKDTKRSKGWGWVFAESIYIPQNWMNLDANCKRIFENN